MLVTILFILFALLLFYTAYFFLTLKAQVFLYYKSSDASEKTKPIFRGFGIAFALCGVFSIALTMIQDLSLALAFLGIVVVIIIAFLIFLNKSM